MLASVAPVQSQQVIADLGGEIIRVVVEKVINNDLIIARIPIATLGKSHSHRMNDILSFRRESGQLGDMWKVMTASEVEETERRAEAKRRANAAERKRTQRKKAHDANRKTKHACR